MTRTVWIAAVFMLLTGFSCERLEINADVPDCVRQMAKSLSREEVRNPPAMIVEWTLETGEKYYYVPPYCCDMYSALYNSGCNLVCAPDGGFTGGGDGRCPGDILNNIESTQIVWEDKRGKD